jgi:antitoxin YefM
MSYHVTADYANKNFSEIIQRAKIEAEGITIVEDNQSFVLIDQEELEALIETAELLQIPELLIDVVQAKKEYQQQETLTIKNIFG